MHKNKIKQKETKRQSNTHKVTQRSIFPIFILQQRFLEAPLVRQADGKLKKDSTPLCQMAQFFLKILFFELNHDARSNQVSTFKGPFGLLFANSSTNYISSVKSICLIHPYEKLKRKLLKLPHLSKFAKNCPKNEKQFLVFVAVSSNYQTNVLQTPNQTRRAGNKRTSPYTV